MVSGSDDGTIKIWDTRRRGVVASLDSKYQVTAVCFNEDATKAFSGGIDNVVKVRLPLCGRPLGCCRFMDRPSKSMPMLATF